MMRRIAIICILLVIIVCRIMARSPEHRILVQFLVNGKKTNSYEKIRIKLIDFGNRKTELQIKDSILQVPFIDKNIKYVNVVITFKHYRGVFKRVDTRLLTPDQNIEWQFGVDEKPFNKEVGVANETDISNKHLTRIVYWKFRPQEHGDGIMLLDRQN